MNGVELLKKFAEEQGISDSVVAKFLSKWNNPKTLEDLMNLPDDMLDHVSYISYLDDPLKSFISDEMWCERYMTIDLERVLDTLYDRIYDLFYEDDNDFDIDEVGIENLETDDEGKKAKLKKLKAVARQIVESKFGSVVYDW